MKKFCIPIILFLNIVFFKSSFSQETNPGDYLFNSDFVHEIRINLIQCNYWDSLLYHKEDDGGTYMQANVTLNGKTYYSCGLRIKGESSFEFYPGKKKSFKIKFNEYVKGQKIDGISTINLNNGFKDPSMMREKIFLDILKKEGIPAPKCTYANLYINNEHFGLYLLVENINKTFLKNNFGNNKGNLYKGEPQAYFNYLGDDPSVYIDKYISEISDEENIIAEDLIQLIKHINDKQTNENDFVSQLDSILNTDNLIKVFAISNILCNTDAYNMFFPHNMYLYFNTESKKFEWIPYDVNYSFCAWSPSLSLSQAENLSLFFKDDAFSTPLLDVIFQKKDYKKKYVNYSKDFLKKKYTNLNFNHMVDSLSLKIRKYVYSDTLKMYSNKEFETNLKEVIGDPSVSGQFIPGILNFYEKRREFLLEEIKKY